MSANNNKNINLYIKYDLSTNYLHEVQIKSLEKICILTAVVNAFEHAEALEEIRRLFLGHGQNNPGNLFIIVLNILGVKYLPKYFKIEILLTIKLVYEEIERFLKSIFLESDKSIFIGNFVFNWQGGINPRQTVLKVLNSNKLSPRGKFEFSCKYLLDEQIVQSYFEVLAPNIQNFYTNSEIFFGPFHYIIFYFIKRFRNHLQWEPADFEDTSDIKINTCKFFLSYLKSNYCTVIGVQFLHENFSLCDFHTRKAIKYLLMQESRDHKINISVYLISRLPNDVLINRFAFNILTNLVKNSRLLDILINYFSILNNHVENENYILLINTVVTEMYDNIKIESKDGKYFTIFKDFLKLIPISAKNFMRRERAKHYAALVFLLLRYEDIELMSQLLLIHGQTNVNIGNSFYEMAKTFFGLFKRCYFSCFRFNDKIERFLRVVVQSEKYFSNLLCDLYITSLNSQLILTTPRFWRMTLPLRRCYSNLYITLKKKRTKWQYSCLENGECVRNSEIMSHLKALIRVEYEEKFLSINFSSHELLILYKKRIVMIIMYNSIKYT